MDTVVSAVTDRSRMLPLWWTGQFVLLTLPEGLSMMWLAIVLLVAWVLGWAVFKVAGGLIHLLLVIAVVVFAYNLISGRRRV